MTDNDFLFDRGVSMETRNGPVVHDRVTPEERIRARMPRLAGEPTPFVEALKAVALFGAGALWMFLALGVWVRP